MGRRRGWADDLPSRVGVMPTLHRKGGIPVAETSDSVRELVARPVVVVVVWCALRRSRVLNR